MALMAFVAIAAPVARSVGLDSWQIGLAVAAAAAAWVILAPAWGALSDRWGRRRTLLVGLTGFASSYALLCLCIALGIRVAAPALIVFAAIVLLRTLAGSFYAAVPATSVALIADNYEPDARVRAIAALGSANGLGMIIGPAAVGWLAHWGLELALCVMAGAPLVGFTIAWRALPEDRARARSNARLRLGDRRLFSSLVVAFTAMFCVGAAQLSVGFYALDRLGLDPIGAARAAGVALAAAGAALVGGQIIVRQSSWSAFDLIGAGASVAAFGAVAVFACAAEIMLVLGYALFGLGMGFIFPAFFAAGANAVQAHEQGAAAGALSAAQGFGSILGPLVAACLCSFDVRAPFILIGAFLLTLAVWSAGRRQPTSQARA